MTESGSREERAPQRRSLPAVVGSGIRRAVERIASASSVIAALTILAAAFTITTDALSRTITGHSIRGVYEIVAAMVVVIGFLGIAQAEVTGNHVRVTLFTGLMPRRMASFVRFVSMALTSVFLSWMLVELVRRAVASFARSEYQPGLLELPLWPSRVLVAFGIASLLLVCITKAVDFFIQTLHPPVEPEHESDPVEGSVE